MPASWDDSAEALLKDWRQRSAAASEAHYKLASDLRRKNLMLGVPVVIFSSCVGTSLFASLADPEAGIAPAFKITIGSISVAAAILAALQTFLRFGERAEKHVVAADWYAAVRRDIEQVLALSPKDRGTPRSCFDRIRKQMSKVGQHSPEIGDRLWKVMAAKYGVDDPAPPKRPLPAPARTNQLPADPSDATVPI
ncbi:MAG: SLATT domain-containing protein [Pseudomonadota bacterium]|nr:SLATT domain-containing protein [Gammaproteobacteria bacterium]MDQ3581475.1 SLATT domain-containing protein [Pseudomonadota bacterium]